MGNCFGLPSHVDHALLPEEPGQVAIGQNQPLSTEPIEWTAEIPMTEGQLKGKRDTFWETAPVYDGRKEIWDALKAAAEAAEEGDHDLAQAILNGASVSLPTGQLTQAYDELGSRYVIPPYCLSRPTNMEPYREADQPPPSPTSPLHGPAQQRTPGDAAKSKASGKGVSGGEGGKGPQTTVKVRLSTLGKDIKLSVPTTDRVRDLKLKLEAMHNVEAKKITMLYAGRVLNNSTLIRDLEIPKGYVIQAVVS